MPHPRPKPTVLADANVFHSNDQRNVLMTLAVERQIDLRWTDLIEREWVNSLERRMPRRMTLPSASRWQPRINSIPPDGTISCTI